MQTARALLSPQDEHDPAMPQLAAVPAQDCGGVHTLLMHALGATHAPHAGNTPHEDAKPGHVQLLNPEQTACDDTAAQSTQLPEAPQLDALLPHEGRGTHALLWHVNRAGHDEQAPFWPQDVAVD